VFSFTVSSFESVVGQHSKPKRVPSVFYQLFSAVVSLSLAVSCYLFCVCCSSQLVKERLLCHAIIGRTGGKELVKRVKIVCEFINPLLQFSTQSICFNVCKVFTCLLSLSCHDPLNIMAAAAAAAVAAGDDDDDDDDDV